MREEIAILKRVVAGSSLGAVDTYSKPKIPEPKAFGGSHSAKELENFMWDMEQYFKAAHIRNGEQVTITKIEEEPVVRVGSMCLLNAMQMVGDAPSGGAESEIERQGRLMFSYDEYQSQAGGASENTDLIEGITNLKSMRTLTQGVWEDLQDILVLNDFGLGQRRDKLSNEWELSLETVS
ncbi:hypothetical protein POM88_012656 [Heracleum sosnowskyi]|uniref:Uncharacterized protein n=1 Tax=Heracleum sosnowskyi TaxID=360622 RepID=A0AAD8MXH0_9APIA|nr:hypothetical protein POM88_012656 [Heracleum sosnowskyi]